MSRRTCGVNADDCVRIAALAPSTALGALDPHEASAVRSHLRGCRRSHAEFREATALAAALGAAWPEQKAPSRALRDRILTAARATTRRA